MSWQEKVDKYNVDRELEHKAEQAKQAEAAGRERAALRERIPPLLEALDRLHARELLTEIRDEVWKLGEVGVEPDLTNLTPGMAIRASVNLVARWLAYFPFSTQWDAEDPSGYTSSPHKVEIIQERLSVATEYYEEHKQKGKIIMTISSQEHTWWRDEEGLFLTDTPEARSKLEELLIRETISRQEYGSLPYDQRKEADESRVVQEIAENELERRSMEYIPALLLPQGFDYLRGPIEKAKEALAAQDKIQSASRAPVPRKGLLSRFLGGRRSS